MSSLATDLGLYGIFFFFIYFVIDSEILSKRAHLLRLLMSVNGDNVSCI